MTTQIGCPLPILTANARIAQAHHVDVMHQRTHDNAPTTTHPRQRTHDNALITSHSLQRTHYNALMTTHPLHLTRPMPLRNSWKAMAYASNLRGHINHCPGGQHVMNTHTHTHTHDGLIGWMSLLPPRAGCNKRRQQADCPSNWSMTERENPTDLE